MVRIVHLLVAVAVTFSPIAGFAASPYVSEEGRGIKALSDQEVADYLSGKGMGFAKAAELNGYPGPAHVLELADQLALSPAQRERTEAVFRTMQAHASSVGKRLIDEERSLDSLFASRAISPALLHNALATIASLQSEVREIHLRAHLEEAEVLSQIQSAQYWSLRGYAENTGHHQHAH